MEARKEPGTWVYVAGVWVVATLVVVLVVCATHGSRWLGEPQRSAPQVGATEQVDADVLEGIGVGELHAEHREVLADGEQHAIERTPWWSRVTRAIEESEYEPSSAHPQQLLRAAERSVAGAADLSIPDGDVLQAPNRAHDFRTYFLDDGVALLRRTAAEPPWVLFIEHPTLRRDGAGRGSRGGRCRCRRIKPMRRVEHPSTWMTRSTMLTMVS